MRLGEKGVLLPGCSGAERGEAAHYVYDRQGMARRQAEPTFPYTDVLDCLIYSSYMLPNNADHSR